ncbi:uncharacterized protein [Magallana gigas]|uniref:uncharacterized protein n=1 Tax=Magallana gigas TaxID=29159 RepID=UPI00333E9D6D
MAAKQIPKEDSSSLESTCSSEYEFPVAPRRQIRKLPRRALDWKIDHLSTLGVYYDANATDLSNFVSVLKDRRDIQFHGLDRLPEIRQKLLRCTEDCWKFSFDFDKEHGQGIPGEIQQTQNAMKEFEENKDNLETRLQTEESEESKSRRRTNILLQSGEDFKSIFYRWRTNLIDFWTYFSMILVRWWKPRQKEGRFTHLFMAFSKICLLYPEPGKMYPESICIRGVDVRGTPAVRFVTLPTTTPPTVGSFLQLIVVTEVKQCNAFKGSYYAETFTYKNVSEEALGQHGVQLLMERDSSFFRPNVVGILCIGTKIIFTYLDINQEHYEELLEKSKEINGTNKARISYTRPFDYMDIRDRHEILELFFWFGFVQSKVNRN